MSTLDGHRNKYKRDKYKTVRMERRDGVLEAALHTDGCPLRRGFLSHGELPEAPAGR